MAKAGAGAVAAAVAAVAAEAVAAVAADAGDKQTANGGKSYEKKIKHQEFVEVSALRSLSRVS